MQQSGSKESTGSKSCSEAGSAAPKFKCPLTLEAIEFATTAAAPPASSAVSPSLTELASYGQGELDAWLHRTDRPAVKRQLQSAQENLRKLGLTGEERIAQLQGKLNELKQWIKESFQVQDLQAWSAQQQREAELLKRSEPHAETTTATRSAAGEVKPVLRIKLIDEKLKSGSAPGATSPPPPSRTGERSASLSGGTGSKNLSRMMSRPEDPKTKVASQAPVNVFWNYVEPFFKPVEESDLRILDDAGRFSDPAPFTIPPLGRHYSEQWREQYGYKCSLRASSRRRASGVAGNGDSPGGGSPSRANSLRERLLAMMIEENLTVPEPSDHGGAEQSVGDTEGEVQPPSLPTAGELAPLKPVDYVHVDERIRQELSESGLCIFVPRVDYQEDDAICAELRTLQRRLREQVCLNHYRKRKLAELLSERLPAQEFYALLADIDRQLEQLFSRRLKVQKKKKRPSGPSGGAPGPSPSPVSATPEVTNLVETRRRLIASFAHLMPSQREFLSVATSRSGGARLFDPEQEERVLEFARESGNWLPVPDLPLSHVKLSSPPAQPVFPALTSAVSPEGKMREGARDDHGRGTGDDETHHRDGIIFEQPVAI